MNTMKKRDAGVYVLVLSLNIDHLCSYQGVPQGSNLCIIFSSLEPKGK